MTRVENGIYRPLRPFYLVGGVLFHLGTNILLGIGFWPTLAIYAIFVPWSSLTRWAGRGLDPTPRALQPSAEKLTFAPRRSWKCLVSKC